jgi:hypothetical protein
MGGGDGHKERGRHSPRETEKIYDEKKKGKQ